MGLPSREPSASDTPVEASLSLSLFEESLPLPMPTVLFFLVAPIRFLVAGTVVLFAALL